MHSPELRERARQMHRAGCTNAAIARQLAVPYRTVGVWFHRDRKRGFLAPLAEPRRKPCPRCQPEPRSPDDPKAYGYLLGQYLGDGHLVTTARVPVLRIACGNAYPNIMFETRAACLTVLANRVQSVNRGGYSHIQSYSTHWPCLIPQHGPGFKHGRKIELEGWQRDLVEEHPRPFLRGLIHSDGCRVINHTTRNGKRYEYPRYHFSNKSADIMGLCGWAFDLVGVEWRPNNAMNLSVAKRASVAVLDLFIGEKTLAAPSLARRRCHVLWRVATSWRLR